MEFTEPIAIIGISAVFPGAPNINAFWDNIDKCVCSSREIPASRWAIAPENVYFAGDIHPDKARSKKGCIVDEIPPVDMNALDLGAIDLERLDPLYRLTLAAGSHAYFDASGKRAAGEKTGVIIGNIALPTQMSSAFSWDVLGRTFAEKLGVKTDNFPYIDPLNRYVTGLPAGLLARALGLGAGTLTLDAACASSLYAIQLACVELLSGRVDAMLSGGVSLPDCLYTQMGFSQLRALSPDGVCSPFDRKQNGLVIGEGAGIVMLKRVSDAVCQGDKIYGLIKGIGLANDIGGELLAPEPGGQLRSMAEAYRQAGWQPCDVDLIECHATGTPLGDAVELESLKKMWANYNWREGQCVIGSVKSNIGHSLTAAGAAGLLKTLMAFRHKTLPATVNFEASARNAPISGSPFSVLKKSRPWQRRDKDTPRRAAINAFGFGGIDAHVLIEEWKKKRKPSPKKTKRKAQALAIVGMDAHFGPWCGLESLAKRVFSEKFVQPTPKKNWFGIESSKWFVERFAKAFRGFGIDELKIPLGRFRIPPSELKEMLGQQLLMLDVAAKALGDANAVDIDHTKSGIFIGIAHDLNTGNFHVRWSIEKHAHRWAKELGLELGAKELEKWTQALRDATGPALNAGRTSGALGSIVASRIAREFAFGGPSFAISSEDSSALSALEVAMRKLQNGEIDLALVGGVDLAGDMRALIGAQRFRPYSEKIRPFATDGNGTLFGEGAGAVVLKRLDDAKKNGERIYALIKGIGLASGGNCPGAPNAKTCQLAFERALQDANCSPCEIGYLDGGSGFAGEDREEAAALTKVFANSDCSVGSAITDFGHAGAASGMASLIKTALCLYYETIPALKGREISSMPGHNLLCFPQFAHYWVRNRENGPRKAALNALSIDGNCGQVILEECENERRGKAPLETGAGLFVVYGSTPVKLAAGIDRLYAYAEKTPGSIERLAARWHQQTSEKSRKAVAFVCFDREDLLNRLALAKKVVAGEISGKAQAIYYNPEPLGEKGKIAFVFPGVGNQHPGMGRRLALLWPKIMRNLDRDNRRLRDQVLPDLFWGDQRVSDQRALLIGHVTLATIVADLLRQFGVVPKAAIGYSLGETSSLFALHAWRDRDEMLRRLEKSSLFNGELTKPYRTVKKFWKFPHDRDLKWSVGVVNASPEKVEQALAKENRVYLLIKNTPNECVIGGETSRVDIVLASLKCNFFPVKGASVAHCEILKEVRDRYRDFHLFDVTPPSGIDFYSGCSGKRYLPTRENAAKSITDHAIQGVDFPTTIETAYLDGVRIFVETGPGASCTRMIDAILGDRLHIAGSVCPGDDRDEAHSLLSLLAMLISENVPVDLDFIYGEKVPAKKEPTSLTVSLGGKPFVMPKLSPKSIVPRQSVAKCKKIGAKPKQAPLQEELELFQAVQEAKADAHKCYLEFAQNSAQIFSRLASLQTNAALTCDFEDFSKIETEIGFETEVSENFGAVERSPFLSREMCLEFAVGSIGKVLGEKFAAIDGHPTRVRLPDEPLMLVDRIMAVDGKPLSMSGGQVLTEHDILPSAWYLDNGRIPTCIAVEAGQADLFLSGYLGIDLKTKGLAVYRLLDASITFHRGLPGPGQVIRYDIRIERFFQHAGTHFFYFRFDSTVDGKPLLSMRNGCAGFFTFDELNAGEGIVHSTLDCKEMPGKVSADWKNLVPMYVESYSDVQIDALRRKDLVGCFGPLFWGLGLKDPLTVPGGRMKLIDRVMHLDPKGGRFGLGLIRAEADIHSDDWFLTCHFCDDNVMPGTLMYECCMHALRILLLRMGWVSECEDSAWEPVPGVASMLKCRGQVIDTTQKVAYEISIKELGYRPQPYAIADALMYADGKPVVEMTDMSILLSGSSRELLATRWQKRKVFPVAPVGTETTFDRDRILAFAIGNPSKAFGKPYRIFDHDRVIARLPGPPYQFLDRIGAIRARQWKMEAGGIIDAEYDVPKDEWYFQADRQRHMPFAVLLEIALQPCGWLAAYLGSALTEKIDLSFRNLGGSAVQYHPITPEAKTLVTRVKISKVASSGGMIIQHYDYDMFQGKRCVYRGDTYFGFFSKKALAEQVGITDAKLYRPPQEEIAAATTCDYPRSSPFPDDRLRMIDKVELFVADGGPCKLGYIRGSMKVDPKAWFFKAHFYQDPVIPGSLGLESGLQLLRFIAFKRWNAESTFLAPGMRHEWTYRGQVIPTDKKVTVDMWVTSIDDLHHTMIASGFLSVDGRVIYQMQDFSLRSC